MKLVKIKVDALVVSSVHVNEAVLHPNRIDQRASFLVLSLGFHHFQGVS